jgi:hypothetical protein
MGVAVIVFTSLAISALGDLTNPLTRRALVHSPAVIETSAAATESTGAAIDAGRGRDTTDRLDGDPTRRRAIVSRLVPPPVARAASRQPPRPRDGGVSAAVLPPAAPLAWGRTPDSSGGKTSHEQTPAGASSPRAHRSSSRRRPRFRTERSEPYQPVTNPSGLPGGGDRCTVCRWTS